MVLTNLRYLTRVEKLFDGNLVFLGKILQLAQSVAPTKESRTPTKQSQNFHSID